jgi:sugar phosphate isomerase/epimerase
MNGTHSRRRFLAGMAASPLLAGGAPANSGGKMYTWLSCATLGVRANQRQAMELAARHGYQAIEPLTEELAAMSEDNLKRLLDDMRTKNLRWGTATMRLGFNMDDAEYASGMKDLPRQAKALQRAGVSRIYKAIIAISDTLTYMQNFKRHVRRVSEIATLMGDHGLRLGLEYSGPKTTWMTQHFPFIHTLAETRELIAAVGKSNLGVDLDTFHWYTAHENEADLASLTNQDIVLVDACDAPAGVSIDQQIKDQRELPCATGTIALGAVMKVLHQIGYDGPVRADPLFRQRKQATDDAAVADAAASVQRLFGLTA